jgi:hypothetical protein
MLLGRVDWCVEHALPRGMTGLLLPARVVCALPGARAARREEQKTCQPCCPEGCPSYASRTPRAMGQRVPPGRTTPGFVPPRRGGHLLLCATHTVARGWGSGWASPPSPMGLALARGRRCREAHAKERPTGTGSPAREERLPSLTAAVFFYHNDREPTCAL